MGPKLTNCCRPEQMDTKEFGKIVKRIQILEEGRVPVIEAKNWRIEGEKTRITRIFAKLRRRCCERTESHARRRLLEQLTKER